MLSIGEFSKISKVTSNTLRYYDEIGLIKPSHVNNENGYRYYDVKQLELILIINKLKTYSFSLDEIGEVFKNNDNEMLLLLMREKHKLIEEKLNKFQDSLKKLENDIGNLERGINIMSYLNSIEVKLTETNAQNVISIRETINTDDYGKLMGKLYERVVRDKLKAVGAPMSIYYSEDFNPENIDVEIAIPVNECNKETHEFPSYLCAMSVFKGPYSELSAVYTRIPQWIEENNYEIIAPPFEVYLSDPMKTSPENYLTEVYFPVRKK